MLPGIVTADDVWGPRGEGAGTTALDAVTVVERSLEAMDWGVVWEDVGVEDGRRVPAPFLEDRGAGVGTPLLYS